MSEQQTALNALLDGLAGRSLEPRDWRPVLSLASETLTIGTLAEAALADGHDHDVPEDVRELLIDVRHRARRRNEKLKGQLSELLPALNAVGIEPILMKGMVRLLTSPCEQARLLSDIDLLIPAGSRDRCFHALGGLEYRIFKDEGHPWPVVLARSRDVGMVDIHTALEPLNLQLHFEQIAPDCRRVEIGCGQVLLPSATCQMVLNILHDQLHDADYWRGLIDLRHLMDVPRLVEEGVDWDQLANFFPHGPPRNALHVHLRTARSLLKIDIPEVHCGKSWARLQVARRRLQFRHPWLMVLFTLLTIIADPPPTLGGGVDSATRKREGMKAKLRRRRDAYLRPTNNGKLHFPKFKAWI